MTMKAGIVGKVLQHSIYKVILKLIYRKYLWLINIHLGVVDHKLKFMSFSIRSGSQNDKSLYNNSSFGMHVHKVPKYNNVIHIVSYPFLHM